MKKGLAIPIQISEKRLLQQRAPGQLATAIACQRSTGFKRGFSQGTKDV